MTKLRLVIPKAHLPPPTQPLELTSWDGTIPMARIEDTLHSTKAVYKLSPCPLLANYAQDALETLETCLETLPAQGDAVERRRALLELALRQRQLCHKLMQVLQARLADYQLIAEIRESMEHASVAPVADYLYQVTNRGLPRIPRPRVTEALGLLSGQTTLPLEVSSDLDPRALERWLRRALVSSALGPEWQIISLEGDTVNLLFVSGWELSCCIVPLVDHQLGWFIKEVKRGDCSLVAWLQPRLNYTPCKGPFWQHLSKCLQWWDTLQSFNEAFVCLEERLQREVIEHRIIWLEEAKVRCILWPSKPWKTTLELWADAKMGVQVSAPFTLDGDLLEQIHHQQVSAWFVQASSSAADQVLSLNIASLSLHVWWDRQAGHARCSANVDSPLLRPVDATLAERGDWESALQKLRSRLEWDTLGHLITSQHGEWLCLIDELYPRKGLWFAIKAIRSLYLLVEQEDPEQGKLLFIRNDEHLEREVAVSLSALNRDEIVAAGWRFELEQARFVENAGLPFWAQSLTALGVNHLQLVHQSSALEALVQDLPGYNCTMEGVLHIQPSKRCALSVTLRHLTHLLGMAELVRVLTANHYECVIGAAQVEIRRVESLMTIYWSECEGWRVEEGPRLSEQRSVLMEMARHWHTSWNMTPLLRILSNPG